MSASGKAGSCNWLCNTKGWWLLPVSRDWCLINIPFWERVFSKSFTASYHPSVSWQPMLCLLSVTGSQSLAYGGTNISNAQGWNQRMVVGFSFECFPSCLVERWKPASFVPVFAQPYLPPDLSYGGAQRKKRQMFYCNFCGNLLGIGRGQQSFQKGRLKRVIRKQICGLWNSSFYTIFVYRIINNQICLSPI